MQTRNSRGGAAAKETGILRGLISFLSTRLIRRLGRLRHRSAAGRLESFPAYRQMGVRVIELSEDWRRAEILLPLNRVNRNPGGGMFGGAIAALADPIAALSCNRVFPGHSVWTRALRLDFVREGRGDLVLRFAMASEQEQRIGAELTEAGKANPEFEFGFYSGDGRLCVRVYSQVAIRPAGYRPVLPAGRDQSMTDRVSE